MFKQIMKTCLETDNKSSVTISLSNINKMAVESKVFINTFEDAKRAMIVLEEEELDFGDSVPAEPEPAPEEAPQEEAPQEDQGDSSFDDSAAEGTTDGGGSDDSFDFGSDFGEEAGEEGDAWGGGGTEEEGSEEGEKKPKKKKVNRKDESVVSVAENVRANIPKLIATRYTQCDTNINVLYNYIARENPDIEIKNVFESAIDKYKKIMNEITRYLSDDIAVAKYEDMFKFCTIVSAIMHTLKKDVERLLYIEKI